jgi:hypothetical protein
MRVGLADPVHDWVPVCGILGGGGTAGHEQHIRAGHVGEGRVDAQVQQVVLVVDYTRVLGADDDLRVVQIGEHLIGADRSGSDSTPQVVCAPLSTGKPTEGVRAGWHVLRADVAAITPGQQLFEGAAQRELARSRLAASWRTRS